MRTLRGWWPVIVAIAVAIALVLTPGVRYEDGWVIGDTVACHPSVGCLPR